MGKIVRSQNQGDIFSSKFDHLLMQSSDVKSLFEKVSTEIAGAFHTDHVFAVGYLAGASKNHVSGGTPNHPRLPHQDLDLLDVGQQRFTHPMIITSELANDDEVGRMLRSHQIAVLMPLRRIDKVIGYLFLGERRSGYSHRELQPLVHLRNELVIAVQNALSLHELKQLNETLQQRIDAATHELRSSNAQLKHLDEVKNEFVSMASHQLRTPLTSVKGYVSMVLEGDAGEITPQQRKLLVEAFNSSERMVHLIADFLNVSRLQTGKFLIDKQQIDLAKIVRQEMPNLKLIAESREVKLKVIVPRGKMPVIADQGKIREVVMNFIDNAIFYSRAGGLVTVTLESNRGDALFAVTDQGIGVPHSEQARLFNKFFRATNARRQRPDGTGVGLYLARKVITAHGGSVLFHSVEGQGSTFGFRLSLENEADDANNNDNHHKANSNHH